MDKEPGQRTREAFEACFVGYAKMIMQPGAWDRVSSQQKAAWMQMEVAIEAPHLAEVARLKAKVAELEASRDGIVAKLGEAVYIAKVLLLRGRLVGAVEATEELITYHASLTQEPPPDLPAPGRDRDVPRRPTVDRMGAVPARDEQGHVHEVGSCSFCDRALRQGATPCLTWQGPEYGGGCRACGRSREEHEERS